MRKFKNIAFLGAIALTGAAVLASCSSSDDVADGAATNPSFDGESVKTQFAINITAPGKTRMDADATQSGTSGGFLGMKDISLIPMTTKAADNSKLSYAIISLKDIAKSNDDKLGTDAKSQYVYKDVTIPVGTKYFLFYGMATGTEVTDDGKTEIKNGALSSTVTDSPDDVTETANIVFKLKGVTTLTSEIETSQNNLAGILTKIAKSEGWATESADQNLKSLYANFTKTDNMVRGGSSAAILHTVQLLYNSIVEKTSDNGNSVYDNILNNIKNGFDITNGTLSYTNTANDEFPASFGLPEGSMQLEFNNEKGEFAYKKTPVLGDGNSLDIQSLTFPAALAYFDHTPLKATNKSDVTWPGTTTAWDNGFTNWSDEVTATTHAIALKNNINYGVAKLETTVKCAAKQLEDNAKTIAGLQNNNRIDVPADGFTVTGVLVGGQPQSVGWQFTSTSTETSSHANTVYDSDVPNVTAKANDANGTNYTLLLDNYKSGTAQNKVNIAIELVNNSGRDFYGADGLIAAGQKFYLIAQLDPNDESAGTVTFPESTKCVYPQTGTKRVFMQDFTTKANLNIKSLKNAYVAIPDLRASQLLLGLSVDLEWQSGLVFNTDIQ